MMFSLYEKVIYTISFIGFAFWCSVLVIDHSSYYLGYIISQMSIYFLFVTDAFIRQYFQPLQGFFFIAKSACMFYGMGLVKSVFETDWGIVLTPTFWKVNSFTTKVITVDILLSLFLVMSLISFVVLAGFGGCCIVATSPCINYQRLYKRFKKPKVNMKRCFKTCNDVNVCVDVCCICLMEYDNTTIQSKMCGHKFHSDCIKTWILNDKENCPLCKTTFEKEQVIIEVM
jgi:hypothetical protein